MTSLLPVPAPPLPAPPAPAPEPTSPPTTREEADDLFRWMSWSAAVAMNA